MVRQYKSNGLADLKKAQAPILIIHYSSESLNDSNEGYSPRITSIVIHNLNSAISHSFSIHLEAEIKNIPKEGIEAEYDALESAMLKNFYDFVKGHQNHYWIHWNMRNIHYGFEMLEHRYKVLGALAEHIAKIPDLRRFNLSDLILDTYGEDCVTHPRMSKLMDLNGGIPKGFLSGDQEAQAFVNKEYVKLHESTLSKVGWFRKMFILLSEKKIATERSSWRIKAHEFCESIWMKILGVFAIVYGIIDGTNKLIELFYAK